MEEEQFERIFARFLGLADKKKSVSELDLEALVTEEFAGPKERRLSLESLQVTTGTHLVPTASVSLTYEGETYSEAAVGDGPIDAVFGAIDRVVKIKPTLIDFGLKAISGGKDAVGEATITVDHEERIFSGIGMSTDVIEASAKAYVSVLNKILVSNGNGAPKEPPTRD